jgi:1-acyl-sn-glycerol-3-phosphate acyltransferase
MALFKKIFDYVVGRLMLTGGWLYALWVFRVINRVEIIGRENVPRTQNVLYVANHQTLVDSFLVGMSVARLTDIILHPSLVPWNAPDQKNFFGKHLFRWIFQHLKNIPVTRGQQGKKSMLKQLEQFGSKLKHGTLLLFFEGTRSRDGGIGDCKAGVAEIILKHKPVVIPILLENIQPIMPIEIGFKFFSLRWFKRGCLTIGKPIKFNGCSTRKDVAKMVRQAVLELEAKKN